MIDGASLTFRRCREQHFLDHFGQRCSLALNSASEGVTTQSAKANRSLHRSLIRLQRQPMIIDHDQHAISHNGGTFSRKIQWHNFDIFQLDVLPDIELCPIR